MQSPDRVHLMFGIRVFICLGFASLICNGLKAGEYMRKGSETRYTVLDINGDVHPFDGSLVTGAINSDLSNADLTDAAFPGYTAFTNNNFNGADLSRANVAFAELGGSTFVGSNLTEISSNSFPDDPLVYIGADFSGADFTNANLLNARLRLSDFSGATFTGADLTNAEFQDTDLTGADFSSGTVVLAGAQFDGADFTGADFTGATVTGADFTGADLANVQFAGADLTGADFNNVNLQGAIFPNFPPTSSPILTGVRSGRITGTPAALPIGWSLVSGLLIGPGADFTNSDFRDSDLSSIDLSNQNFSGSDLTNAILTNATLASADLTGTTLAGVKSGGISGVPVALPADWLLVGGYLIGPEADLSGANLTGLNLSSATLTGVVSGGITAAPFPPLQLPSGWELINGHLVGPGANLTNADLSGADLDGMDLSGAILTGLQSGSVTGTPAALPVGWVLLNGYLIGPGADLTNANLSGLDADGLDLSSSTLIGVSSGGVTGTPTALPADWNLINGYLVGPGANLAGASFIGVDLSNVSIDGATLTGAILSGVSSGSVSGTPSSLPSGWGLVGGYFIGSDANLQSANLSNLDLSGRDLSAADLSSANLTNTNLTGTDLSNADLTGVTGDSLLTRLVNAEVQLESEYTLSEIVDLRPGSTTIAISEGSATIQMQLQESTNLADWDDVGSPIEANVPASGGAKFFRFGE